MPRKVFVSGEILTAADVNTNLMDQAVMVFDDSAARTTAIPSPSEGMVTYLKDTNAVEKFDGSNFVNVDTGKILQVIRNSNSTERTTTSTTFVDVPSMTVSITPTLATSRIVVVCSFNASTERGTTGFGEAYLQLTDSADAGLSGAENVYFAQDGSRSIFDAVVLMAEVAAGSTAARTYKLRFRRDNAPTTLKVNYGGMTGQLFAYEIGA